MHKGEIYRDLKGKKGGSATSKGIWRQWKLDRLSAQCCYLGTQRSPSKAQGGGCSTFTSIAISLGAVPEAEATLLLRITYSDIYLHQWVFKKNPPHISQTNSWGLSDTNAQGTWSWAHAVTDKFPVLAGVISQDLTCHYMWPVHFSVRMAEHLLWLLLIAVDKNYSLSCHSCIHVIFGERDLSFFFSSTSISSFWDATVQLQNTHRLVVLWSPMPWHHT